MNVKYTFSRGKESFLLTMHKQLQNVYSVNVVPKSTICFVATQIL